MSQQELASCSLWTYLWELDLDVLYPELQNSKTGPVCTCSFVCVCAGKFQDIPKVEMGKLSKKKASKRDLRSKQENWKKENEGRTIIGALIQQRRQVQLSNNGKHARFFQGFFSVQMFRGSFTQLHGLL